MSLTIVSSPANVVTNIPSYNVTTDIVEGAGYNNVRIRANIYVDGVVKAVLEQPKGLADFDFYNVLKAFCGRLNVAPRNATILKQPTVSTELLTGWTNIDFTTFTTVIRVISEAIKASGTGWAKSNDLGAMVVGDIIVVGTESTYAVTSGEQPYFYLTDLDGVVTGHEYVLNYANQIRFFMVTTTMTESQITIGRPSGAQNWLGGWTIKKIAAGSTAQIGQQAIYFKIGFSEYYEDATGTTIAGSETLTDCLLFIPSELLSGETFATNYLMSGTGSKKFLHDSLRGGMKFKRLVGQEFRVMFASDETYIKAFLNTTIRGDVALSDALLNVGYGFFVVNELSVYSGQYFFNTDTANTTMFLKSRRNVTENVMSEVLTVTQLTTCYPDLRAIEFVGRPGGLETIIFAGSPTIKNQVEKEYYKNTNRINIPYNNIRKKEIILRTINENASAAYVDIMWQLIESSRDVWMFQYLTPYYKIIGILSDEVTEYDRAELFTNEIRGEYV